MPPLQAEEVVRFEKVAAVSSQPYSQSTPAITVPRNSMESWRSADVADAVMKRVGVLSAFERSVAWNRSSKSVPGLAKHVVLPVPENIL